MSTEIAIVEKIKTIFQGREVVAQSGLPFKEIGFPNTDYDETKIKEAK